MEGNIRGDVTLRRGLETQLKHFILRLSLHGVLLLSRPYILSCYRVDIVCQE